MVPPNNERARSGFAHISVTQTLHRPGGLLGSVVLERGSFQKESKRAFNFVSPQQLKLSNPQDGNKTDKLMLNIIKISLFVFFSLCAAVAMEAVQTQFMVFCLFFRSLLLYY